MTAPAARVKTRDEFDAVLEGHKLRGQWRFDEDIQRATSGPRTSGVPHLWPWREVEALLLEACDVMPDSLLQRRNVSFMNPGLRSPNATNTIAGGIQLVTPGEVAYAHRHTMGAIRFGIQGGEELYTVVNGDRLPLHPNDLVLTPSWTWHDHHNETDRNGAWLDVLDVPLAIGLDQAKFEPYGDSTQPINERPSGTSLRFPWSEIEPQLRSYANGPGSPYDDVLFEYINPETGGATLPTFGCFIQLLRPGFEGRERRRTAGTIYHVVAGSGVTLCGDVELRWTEHDSFVVPSGVPHAHLNASASAEAMLFSATDQPLLQAMGLYREEPTPFAALNRKDSR